MKKKKEKRGGTRQGSGATNEAFYLGLYIGSMLK